VLRENRNVMAACGRTGPMCLPVYDVMEKLEPRHRHVAFRDLDFDSPTSQVIRRLPQVRGFNGLPFTVYFRDGQSVANCPGVLETSGKEIADVMLAEAKRFGCDVLPQSTPLRFDLAGPVKSVESAAGTAPSRRARR
jgi:hypothetical protein